MDIDPTMSTLLTFLLTSSILTPFIGMLVNQPTWSKPVRQAAAAGVAVVVAIGTILLTGGFQSLTQGATSILLVIGLSTLAYDALWKPTGVATAVETMTSPTVVDSTGVDVTETE